MHHSLSPLGRGARVEGLPNMRIPILLIVVLFAAACAQPKASTTTPSDVRTIENTPINALPIEPLPTIDEPAGEGRIPVASAESPATRTKGTSSSKQEELARKMNLPFAPAITMDPIDGSKISIGPDTPVVEYKNRLYYFGSVKNKQAFLANPDTYLKEKLSTY